MSGKIVTNDFNLNKVAQLQRGRRAQHQRAGQLPASRWSCPARCCASSSLKEGKEAGQGVAYLDDGTMVVVDQGKRALGRTIEVTVTSVLQTTAGKMIFCRWADAVAAAEAEAGRREPRAAERRDDRRDPRDNRGEHRREGDRPTRPPPPTGRRSRPSLPADRTGPTRPAPAVLRTLVAVLVQAPLAVLLTAGYSSAATVAALVDRTGRTTRRVGGAWSRALLRLARIEVTVEGAERAPVGPALWAANHASALDILVVFGYIPVDFRIVYKRSLSFIPLLGWSIRLGGHVPIDRRNAFHARRSLEAAARRIRGGTSVVVFPEGTRSPDGSVRRFKRGSFTLALEAGVPVVPVSLVGIKSVVPRGLSSVRPGRVRVRIQAPVEPAGRGPEEAEALAEEVRRIVAAGCQEGGAG